MPVQASIRLLALVLRRPNHILANSLVPVMFCDYDYEETNASLAASLEPPPSSASDEADEVAEVVRLSRRLPILAGFYGPAGIVWVCSWCGRGRGKVDGLWFPEIHHSSTGCVPRVLVIRLGKLMIRMRSRRETNGTQEWTTTGRMFASQAAYSVGKTHWDIPVEHASHKHFRLL